MPKKTLFLTLMETHRKSFALNEMFVPDSFMGEQGSLIQDCTLLLLEADSGDGATQS